VSHKDLVRTQLRTLLTRTERLVLEATIPSLESVIRDIDAFGLYLHIPFCHQICPYCPYNKVLFSLIEVPTGYTWFRMSSL